MFNALTALFGKAANQPAKKPLPTAKHEPSKTGGDFRAVTLVPGSKRCMAAKADPGKRYLSREAPRLPLVGCTMSAACTCKFQKHADVRDGDRRAFGSAEISRWLSAPERRQFGGRRPIDNLP